METLKTPTQLLTLQTAEIDQQTIAIRSLDWERDRFDVEFALLNGTTYNSFIIQGEKTALVDTSHNKFRDQYLELLGNLVDLKTLDYLIISHTEPDHSGLVKQVLELAPQVTVIGSKVALQFLENLVHQPFERQIVKNGDKLDLGLGHVLEFVNAPNLHWPDTILTYDWGTGILFTCDVFGMHYCADSLFDENLEVIETDFHIYYQCLMAPNMRSVTSALKRIDKLGKITTVANGHGPLLRYHVEELMGRYRSWSQAQAKTEQTVAVFYVSDYGDSNRLCSKLIHGLAKAGVSVETLELTLDNQQEVRQLVERSAAIVIGMPPATGEKAAKAATTLGTILASVHEHQVIGVLESYGGDEEPIDPLLTRFRNLGLKEVFPSIRITDTPTEETYQLCEQAGTDLGQWLSAQKATKKPQKSSDNELTRAMGRLSGGRYIITAQKEGVKGAMVVSWVAQASLEPIGISVNIAKDCAIDSLMEVGDRFVLNVLEEGNYQSLTKHFLKRVQPSADQFAGIKTQSANNGAPILSEALAYLECEVVSRLECSDHWVIYSHVDQGCVSKAEALTAIHHRKLGNHY